MSRHWMPMYWADFKADTDHLGALETGAYMMLIGHYWTTGGLPDDDRKLARIARMTPDEWAEARQTIAEFFQDGWRHKRIDAELADAQAAYDRRAAAGRRGGHAKAQSASNATAMPEQCYSENVAMLKQSQPQPHIDTNVSIIREPTALAILSECLTEQTAKDLIAHRKAKRSPMTAGAAKALVKSFRAYGDAEGAAQAMMARGWTGFKAEWMRETTRAGPAVNGRGGMASLLAKTMGLKDGRESRNPDEAVHVLSLDYGAQRGNVSDDGRQLPGDVIDIFAANTG